MTLEEQEREHDGSWPGLDPGRRRQLAAYLELLYSAPASLKLTTVPRRDAERRHLDEALDLLPARSWLGRERVLDLGSGAGLPGVPLAIALPQLSVTLLERNRARAAFLRGCVGRLGLERVGVVAADAAELYRRPDFEPFQVLISRAAVPPGRLLRLARRLLGPGGEGLVHVARSLRLDDALTRAGESLSLEDLRLFRSGSSTLLSFRRALPQEGRQA